jgi:cobalt/nickel transport protein
LEIVMSQLLATKPDPSSRIGAPQKKCFAPARVALCAMFMVAALLPSKARAHFQEMIPGADVLMDGGEVTLDLTFTHPMERGPVMPMAAPKRVGVKVGDTTTDLLPALKTKPVDGKAAYQVTHALKEPGAAAFFIEPAPYFEPAEGKYIVHFTKVIVDAFASGDGWDTMIGLPVEIEPLTRPTGLWTGNLFRGVVHQGGKPVPFAEIEVEWRNDGSVTAPNDAFVTQVIKADANGAFAYAMPRAGWWGFAALLEAPDTMKAPDGADVPVEWGALIWVKATDMGGQ